MLEDKARKLSSEVKTMTQTMKQLSRDLEVMSVQDAALDQRIRDLEQQDGSDEVIDPTHLAALEKKVSGLEKEHKKAAAAAGKVQGEVTR